MKFLTLIIIAFGLLSSTACVRQPLATDLHASALERLKKGNDRFVRHHPKHPDQSAARLAATAHGQRPFAVIITCSDSRVVPEIIFDEGIGDLFVIRNAGNIVEDESVLASVEYAIEHLGVGSVVVLGHEHCGAIEAMTHPHHEHEPAHITNLVNRLKSEPEEQEALSSGEKGDALVHSCVLANVAHGLGVLQHLQTELHGKQIEIIGAVYDMSTGKVQFCEVLPSGQKEKSGH